MEQVCYGELIVGLMAVIALHSDTVGINPHGSLERALQVRPNSIVQIGQTTLKSLFERLPSGLVRVGRTTKGISL